MNIDNITIINNIIINRKFVHVHLILFFSMLLDVKPFKILPKHNGYGFILEFFALN